MKKSTPRLSSSFIMPSGWIPCSRQYSSQQAFPIWTPACPTWMDITSRCNQAKLYLSHHVFHLQIGCSPFWKWREAVVKSKWRFQMTTRKKGRERAFRMWVIGVRAYTPCRLSFSGACHHVLLTWMWCFSSSKVMKIRVTRHAQDNMKRRKFFEENQQRVMRCKQGPMKFHFPVSESKKLKIWAKHFCKKVTKRFTVKINHYKHPRTPVWLYFVEFETMYYFWPAGNDKKFMYYLFKTTPASFSQIPDFSKQ